MNYVNFNIKNFVIPRNLHLHRTHYHTKAVITRRIKNGVSWHSISVNRRTTSTFILLNNETSDVRGRFLFGNVTCRNKPTRLLCAASSRAASITHRGVSRHLSASPMTWLIVIPSNHCEHPWSAVIIITKQQTSQRWKKTSRTLGKLVCLRGLRYLTFHRSHPVNFHFLVGYGSEKFHENSY